MGSTAAYVKSPDWRPIIAPARYWTQAEELVEWHRSLEDVSACQAECSFQVEW